MFEENGKSQKYSHKPQDDTDHINLQIPFRPQPPFLQDMEEAIIEEFKRSCKPTAEKENRVKKNEVNRKAFFYPQRSSRIASTIRVMETELSMNGRCLFSASTSLRILNSCTFKLEKEEGAKRLSPSSSEISLPAALKPNNVSYTQGTVQP